MTIAKKVGKRASLSEVQRLIDRAERQDVVLSRASARIPAMLDPHSANRMVDGVCRLMQEAKDEGIHIGLRAALNRIEACGGDVNEAIRRTVSLGAEAREGVPETIQYAAERGIVLTPQAIVGLFRRRGIRDTRRYIDDLGTIMDAASTFSIDCTQARAIRLVIRADGNARRVVADFAAQHRRRADRRIARCQVTTPPRALDARTNAFAGCGCPRCCERLATHMQPYIAKLVAQPYFAYLDRDEARAEANLELIQSIETWPGGNFTGWFAARFSTRVKQIYRSRPVEQDEMLSLDATGVLTNDDGGRTVSLGEQVPDRSVDVLSIVIWREQLAEAALKQRQRCADRGQEFNERRPRTQTHAAPRQELRLVSSKVTLGNPAHPAQIQLSRKAA
jgi:hypothetical protein